MRRTTRRERFGAQALHREARAALALAWIPVLAVQSEPPAAAQLVPLGERLVADSNCLDCHAAPTELTARLVPRKAPRLDGLARRVDPTWLAEYFAREGWHGDASGTTRDLATNDLEALVAYLESAALGGEAVPPTSSSAQLERGRRSYHSLGCVACHPTFEHAWEHSHPFWLPAGSASEPEQEAGAPPEPEPEGHVPAGVLAPLSIEFRELERRHTVASLSAYLREPLRYQPDGRMPDFRLSEGEAEDLAIYLLREQALGGERVFRGDPGLRFERFENISADRLPDFDALSPAASGLVFDLSALPPHPDDRFGFRYRGVVRIPRPGNWTFTTVSDDGSRLALAGEPLVDNDGLHAAQAVSGTRALEAGEYSIEVEYWEASGDEQLDVLWEGPGVAQQVIPSEVLFHRDLEYRSQDSQGTPDPEARSSDPTLIARGLAVFERLRCASCHGPDHAPDTAPAGPPWEALARASERGCLASEPQPGTPTFAFDASERAALLAFVRTGSAPAPLSASEQVERTLLRLNCHACHRRDGRGGPHPERASYFRTTGDFDLGDEGRLPPHLTGVGSKLTPAALAHVLSTGAGVRPYLATRMPRFGDNNVEQLPALLRAVDGEIPAEPSAPTPQLLRAGRQLVGTRAGWGCIDCHRFGGYDSLGLQAADLLEASRRIEPGWFTRLLIDPQSVEMNSRMPSFLQNGRSPVDVFDGDGVRQIQAILAYLAQGDSAPLPPGLVTPDSQYEVDPLEGPRIVSVFMKDVSARTILVGLPAGVHYAFDAQRSRLAKAWRGRFFNARGTWEGRAGALESPPGNDVFEFAAGPAFARLANPSADWPSAESSPRRLGQRYDQAGVPTFRSTFDGVTVDEACHALVDRRTGGLGLRRVIELRSDDGVGDLWFRLHVGSELPDVRGSWSPQSVVRRTTRTGVEWLVPIVMQATDPGYQARLEIEVRW